MIDQKNVQVNEIFVLQWIAIYRVVRLGKIYPQI